MNIPTDLKYAATHEWVRVEGDVATVGITDHAQAELTDIVFAEPPKPGTRGTAGEAIAVVESVKAASDIYAPFGGEVIASNDSVARDPSLLNSDPYGEGWLYKARVEQPTDLDGLKSPDEYRAHIGG
jgi:glycine cleavage system H protein